MSGNLSILITFAAILAVTVGAAWLLKTFRMHAALRNAGKVTGAKEIDLELKGDIFELSTLAIVLDDMVRYDVPVKTILDLNIILEEIYSIIIKHQPERHRDRRVQFHLKLDERGITATVKDRNEPFDPTAMPKIDLNAPIEEISFTGLGFHMIRHLADSLSYKRVDDQNVLTIRKSYPAA